MRDFSLFAAGIVVALSGNAVAETKKPTIERVDPGKTVSEALSGVSDDCVIIKTENGKIYKQCPYKVTPELQSQIDELDK